MEIVLTPRILFFVFRRIARKCSRSRAPSRVMNRSATSSGPESRAWASAPRGPKPASSPSRPPKPGGSCCRLPDPRQVRGRLPSTADERPEPDSSSPPTFAPGTIPCRPTAARTGVQIAAARPAVARRAHGARRTAASPLPPPTPPPPGKASTAPCQPSSGFSPPISATRASDRPTGAVEVEARHARDRRPARTRPARVRARPESHSDRSSSMPAPTPGRRSAPPRRRERSSPSARRATGLTRRRARPRYSVDCS